MPISKNAFFFSLFFLVLLISCKEKEISNPFTVLTNNNTNAFQITGDNYSLTTFYQNQQDSNTGYYDTSLHRTFIYVSGDSSTNRSFVNLSFAGYYSSNYPKLMVSPDTLTVSVFDKVTNTISGYASVSGKTTIFVTKYDLVKGKISGSYFGKVVNKNNFLDTVLIANGRFDVTRLPDKY